MSYVVEILGILIWPALILFVGYVLLTPEGSKLLDRLLSSTRRLKIFGVELELGEEQAGRIKLNLEETFAQYRQEVKSAFDLEAQQFDIARLCERVAESDIEPKLGEEPRPDYRCAVYVPDIVFDEVLYRLTDYYPGGGGRGSIYPTRYGIIGRSWRLDESLFAPTVPADRAELIENWGMTKEEAATQKPRSFVTVLLTKDEHQPPVGLLYVEAAESAFSTDPCDALAGSPQVQALTDGVALVMDKMLARGPRLELFQS